MDQIFKFTEPMSVSMAAELCANGGEIPVEFFGTPGSPQRLRLLDLNPGDRVRICVRAGRRRRLVTFRVRELVSREAWTEWGGFVDIGVTGLSVEKGDRFARFPFTKRVLSALANGGDAERIAGEAVFAAFNSVGCWADPLPGRTRPGCRPLGAMP